MELGKKILLLLEAKQVTQKQMVEAASRAGLSLTAAYVSRLKNGTIKSPTIDMGKTLARGLEVSQRCINTDEMDQEIECNPKELVSRESLAIFLLENRIPEDMSIRLEIIKQKCIDPPKTVQGWRDVYETLVVDDNARASGLVVSLATGRDKDKKDKPLPQ
jgi:transcriptional regulator with XRE-family HTH domain